MKLKDLLFGTDVQCPSELDDVNITGIAFNSEEVMKGDVFVSIKGQHDKSKFYALDAAFKGAKVIITEEDFSLEVMPVLRTSDGKKLLSQISHIFYENQNAFGGVIVGVTGTNGKTTTCYMIKNILEVAGRACGNIGTIEYSFAGKTYQAINTTPDFCYLEKLLLEMERCGVRNCVMEVSSQAIELGRVDGMRFSYGIFTNLTEDHLDFHKDMSQYYQAKKKLFFMTDIANIINIDDVYGKRLSEELKSKTSVKLRSYSLKGNTADYTCNVLQQSFSGTTIEVCRRNEVLGQLTVQIPGTYMLENAMAAIAVACESRVSFEKIKEGIETLSAVPGRFEIIENPKKQYTVIVDFAHTPDAVEKILSTVLEIKRGRVLCLFGCGGDREREKRKKMGNIVGRLADYAIITSDNPRTEEQSAISEEIEEGMYETGCEYQVIDDRLEAIRFILDKARADDVVLVLGKGHEKYQIIGEKKFFFDDKETVLKLIEG